MSVMNDTDGTSQLRFFSTVVVRRVQLHPNLEYQAICSVCELQILLLRALGLCNKNALEYAIFGRKTILRGGEG